MNAPRMIITRPRREAQPWVNKLSAQGYMSCVLPLIDILPMPLGSTAAKALEYERSNLQSYDAVMFVSGNAARFFMNADTATRLDQIQTRAWATGDSTRSTLLELGWPHQRIDAPNQQLGQRADSETLWALVHDRVRADQQVLIVRGCDEQGGMAGRMWLADTLRSAGAVVQSILAYRRVFPQWNERQMSLARGALVDESLWVLSSSEAVDNLANLIHTKMPDLSLAHAKALATHERIAAAARKAGFGSVCQIEAGFDALQCFIKSIQ